MKSLSFAVPVKEDGSFDLEIQKALAARYDAVTESIREASRTFTPLLGLEPEILSQATTPTDPADDRAPVVPETPIAPTQPPVAAARTRRSGRSGR